MNKITKADRKAMRTSRRLRLIDDYRGRCRSLILDLRRTRAEPADFRDALKRMRHSFSALVAGRRVQE